MKDAYSFSTEQQFKDIYEQMRDTYIKIFEELGLKTDVVAADNGYIGGEYCHELISESDQGESRYFVDKETGEAAHEDVAIVIADDKNIKENFKELQEVNAVRGTTMEDGAKLHGLPLWQQIKDVLYFDETAKKYLLCVIRGDFEVNETKLTHVADAWNIRSATEEEIREDLNSEPGFISPVKFIKKGSKSGHPVVIIADKSLRTIKNAYGGANKKNRDLLNMNIDRDFRPDIEADIAMATSSKQFVEKRGIEVGNIFQLGYHYSNLMEDAEYTDEKGLRQKYYMGCYGIGIGRTMAAIVEKFADEKGLVWPDNVAPFQVYLASVGTDSKVIKASDELYELLKGKNIEVLYDDRDVRPGTKFADADLLGIPYRAVISEKSLEKGGVEVKKRAEDKIEILSNEKLIKLLAK